MCLALCYRGAVKISLTLCTQNGENSIIEASFSQLSLQLTVISKENVPLIDMNQTEIFRKEEEKYQKQKMQESAIKKERTRKSYSESFSTSVLKLCFTNVQSS